MWYKKEKYFVETRATVINELAEFAKEYDGKDLLPMPKDEGEPPEPEQTEVVRTAKRQKRSLNMS